MKLRGSGKVFFPWERRRGVFGVIGRARVRTGLGIAIAILFFACLYAREETAAGVRSTRASITTMYRAVAAYRADHAGGCPRALGELVLGGYVRDVPIDAWGQPLRLTCPGRRDAQGFEIASDGPDGIAGGLDRVE